MAERLRPIRAFSHRIFDYIFPPLCIVCDKPRSADDRWLCDGCKERMRANHDSRNPCPRCAMNRDRGHCACTRGWNQPFESAFSILDFDDTIQAIMHQVKYRGKQRFAQYLGAMLAGYVPEEIVRTTDALVAVPLHRKRRKKRGYNQSLLFARGLNIRFRDIPLLDDVVVRLRDTPSQTTLDKKQRLKNMKGAFTVVASGAEKISGKRIVLVDDIVTTGATAAAAATALLGAGAASVRVVSIARTSAPGSIQ